MPCGGKTRRTIRIGLEEAFGERETMMDEPDRLASRPGTPRLAGAAGLQTLPLGGARDSYLFVPARATAGERMPLVLLLHGAGGHAHDGLRVLMHLAEENGLILVAPASRASTWDIIARRRYGPDLALADAALAHVFERHAVDPSRLAVGGFSDGASYALSLGLNNGDLFTHVLAFSPGFVGPGTRRGKPRVFISHGVRDPVLPIDPCSRSIVRGLRAQGYPVEYEEFDGEHEIPPQAARAAVDLLCARVNGGQGPGTDFTA
jgi:phospholipase/carboxylesterase